MSATDEQIAAMMQRAYGDMQPGSAYRDGVRAAERRGRSVCESCGEEFTPRRDTTGRFCTIGCYRATFPEWWHEWRRERERQAWPSTPKGLLAEIEYITAMRSGFTEETERGE